MLSTPLICCSIGVATDCSTVKASAPTYVVLTWTSGGVMFGNCAVGRPTIATMPTITMTIEITMETIGRFMKNLYTILLSGFAACRVWDFHRGGARLKGRGADFHALAHLLHSLGHDTVAGFQAFVDNPHSVNLRPDLNRANTHLVIRADYCGQIPALQLIHRTLRDEQGVLLNPHHCADVAKSTGT